MPEKGQLADPLWYKDAIIYQIHIKSFFDSNADGFGDLQGLIQKLDYIQDLGVDTIWVLPFYPSPLRDDGYDIADYESINPVYGNDEDLRQLLYEAHRRGLRVVTELVINHTSDQHPWFQAARVAPPGSRERNYYVWSDTDEKYKDARVIFTDTEKSNWTWDPVAKQYYWHRFFSHQPDLNFDSPEVFDSLVRVMRKWLDMGVDGLRLDAIPYLKEREGTNCENLPETHDILKRMRAVVDQHYFNRVFLAEANQWPTDVREYFGEGDECHMAFHFPVMPRMYMALHLEDRHPITDILRQTPEIPESCQWAMFLRNHDELTLEMVTDDERDYMYQSYASNPLMRINVGIRRRLAPLMEYSKPKIQLMNSLLLSLPGTPVLYYGDEIGMGDNIYLPDRHGVRTPMQWSPDRNGGFSQAPFEQLYLPPIMDPITGIAAVNVESQQLDPSSLLNWMRSIIKLRKKYQVFGRGSLEIISADNRKVLSFIRKHEDETVLCVANLSRYPQAAEFKLPGFSGVSPVEMFGLSKFPVIGEQPYVLTLGPHQFYWLLLSKVPDTLPMPASASVQSRAVKPVAAARSAIKILDTKAEDVWADIVSGGMRDRFENEVLPKYILKQRWFGKKSQGIKSAKILDYARIRMPAEQAGIVMIQVESADGTNETYSMCLSVASGYRAKEMIEFRPQHVLADLRRRSESIAVYDALQSDVFCRELLTTIRNQTTTASTEGNVEAEVTALFETIREGAEGHEDSIRRLTSEQSNSSIIYGQHFILKLFRKLQSGVNPDYQIGRYLREETTFKNIPAVCGAINYTVDGKEFKLGLLQEFLTNQGDGWTHTVEEFRRFYERSESRSHLIAKVLPEEMSLQQLVSTDLPPEANNMLGIYLAEAETLGRRTGEMHVALASGTAASGFTAEPISPEEMQSISSGFHDNYMRVIPELEGRRNLLPNEVVGLVDELIEEKLNILKAIEVFPKVKAKLQKIRVHGDYHLGQVLNSFGDFILFDFEGEPGRPLAERLHKQSALKDVAGMMRSFNYAAYASLFRYLHNRSEDWHDLTPWAAACSTWSSAAFLRGYLAATAGQTFIPQDPGEFFEALLPFIFDKALYEINYELNNRPDWLSIPVAGLLQDIRTVFRGTTANVR